MKSRRAFRRKRRSRGCSPKRQRVLRFETLEVRHLLNGDGISVVDDHFHLNQNGPQVELDVLANDLFEEDYTGERLITSVSFGSEGGRIEIAEGGEGILYTPPADFEGTETFVYAVDGEHTGTVSVSVRAPVAHDKYEFPPDGVTREMDVLANDPFWKGYEGARRITSVSVASGGGTVEIASDGKSVFYTADDDLSSNESFVYVVDDLYPALVKISSPNTLKHDSYLAARHDPTEMLNVLVNDPFWNGQYPGERRITHVTASRIGAEITIAPDGKSLRYTQPADFSGYGERYLIRDSFQYVVDGVYEAPVHIHIYRPVQNDFFEVDENSTEFEYNVTKNDFFRPSGGSEIDVIDRVTSVTQPESGGTVTISEDGQSVVYSPPEGFSGTDTFTYMADELHQATVRVQVTRPVRDDFIRFGVFQDTPDNVVDVLANDFIGNGYAGDKLITGLGETDKGGEISISADGKRILYTPANGYVGQDRFKYTVDGTLEAEATVNVRALAQPDNARLCVTLPHGVFSLSVLENDHFNEGYLGPGKITHLEVIHGSSEVTIVDGSVVKFAPDADGFHVIQYTVDNQYEAKVSVFLPLRLRHDSIVVDQNSNTASVNVLANDFRSTRHCPRYSGLRAITGVTNSLNGGTVTIAEDGKSVSYTPPEDFYGRDSFTYTVDDFMTQTVDVEVIRRVRDDTFRVDTTDGTQALPVLVNDLFGANYSGTGQITHVTTTSQGGTAVIGENGQSIDYTPAEGFVGVDTFTYTVDGQLKAEVSVVVDAQATDQFPTFGGVDSYLQFLLDDALGRYEHLFGKETRQSGIVTYGDTVAFDTNGASPTRNHSETNVQVAGVDEGDIVEFDSDYVYTLTVDGVVIADAWPAEELYITSRIDIEGKPIVQYLHGDRLTVISQPLVSGINPWFGLNDVVVGDGFWVPPQPTETLVTVIDVSDRTEPTIVQQTTMEGTYVDSRGVGDFVYVLVNNPGLDIPRPEVVDEDNDPSTINRYETAEEFVARVKASAGEHVEAALPSYSSYGPDGELVRTGLLNTPETVYQPLVPDARNLLSVVSFNVESDEPGLTDTSAVYSTGAGTIYASLDNFYVFDADYSPEDGKVTRIVKFDWEPTDGSVEFVATTTVAGSIINQFSADETTRDDGQYLRIATTATNHHSGNWSGRDENMLFVLQEDDGVFEFVGGLQNLALNEDIRSVRFLGERAFVTTFREVDPLFAMDLSDPAQPRAVGHITLPGFTSYMHLVDQNFLLTVGKNTPGGGAGPTQVSLFDIEDMTQPRRIAEYTFPRFSTSEAEIDHHAFGYFAEHGLLGMPVVTNFVERVDLDGDGYRETRRRVHEDFLAVFSVDVSADDPTKRLQLATEIEHDSPVRRSGYIGDKLYSIAGKSIHVVDVDEIETVIATLSLVEETPPPPPASVVSTASLFTDSWIVDVDYRGILIDPIFTPNLRDTPIALPEAPEPEPDPLPLAISQARASLTSRLGLEEGAPMLVSVETMPHAPGGGYALVFQVDGQHFLYRAGAGKVLLLDDDYQFDVSADAWHSVSLHYGEPILAIAGDYNLDGQVDQLDYTVWQQSAGEWSLTSWLPADGNRDGKVDASDYTLWRNRLDVVGYTEGDYNRDGKVNMADLDFWRSSLGSSAGTGLQADGNGNGIVDVADFRVWRDSMMRVSQPRTATSPLVAATDRALAELDSIADDTYRPSTEHARQEIFHELGEDRGWSEVLSDHGKARF